MSDKQIEYSVFCIENVAKELGKSGSELFQILNSSGLLHSYIIPSYEALHTQSKQYIVDEIISVLKEQRLKFEKPNNQICFINQKVVDNLLHFESSYEAKGDNA